MMQILTLVLLGASILIALRAVYRRAYGFSNRTIVDVIPFLQDVSVEQLAELIDSSDERFLRSNLGEKEFKKAQLKRMRLLREYVNRMAHNSAVLLEWARSDRRKSWDSGEKEWEELSEYLVKACLHFQAGAFTIRLALHRWMIKSVLLPAVSVPNIAILRRFETFDLFDAYEAMKLAAENLSAAYGDEFHQKLAQSL